MSSGLDRCGTSSARWQTAKLNGLNFKKLTKVKTRNQPPNLNVALM